MAFIDPYIERFQRSRVVTEVEQLAKKIILPGFEGLALYDVIQFFFRGLAKGSLMTRAKSLSFTFFLSLFPAILFFFTIIPYLPVEGFQETLMESIEGFLPPKTFDSVQQTIEGILIRGNSGLLSISFLMALIFSTNGTKAMIDSFNKTYHFTETRSAWRLRLMALYFVLLISVFLIVAIVAIIIGGDMLQWVLNKGWIEDVFVIDLIGLLKYVITVLMMFLIISVIYYYAPAKRLSFRFFSPGSILATTLFVMATLGFDYYVNNFSRYNALYGSIGTLIIFMLWINFNSIILLIGFELNASMTAIIRKRDKESEKLTKKTRQE